MASACLQQRTPAWHAARKGKLTASNVGAALGLCPWTTRQQAFNRAMGLDKFLGAQIKHMIGTEIEWCFCSGVCNGACAKCLSLSRSLRKWRGRVARAGNDATRWGTSNEANGILAYSAHTGNIVQNTGLHVHPSTPWLAGSPDGLIGTEGLLEVKCPYWKKKDGTRVHAEIPPHYYMQMTLCLECTDRNWCDYISWSPEGYRIYRVTRDANLHDLLLPHYLSFFAAMQRMAMTPPVVSKTQQEEITTAVKESMAKSITYEFWSNSDLEDEPPVFDDDEPTTKRVKFD